jgi:hypothetical protein
MPIKIIENCGQTNQYATVDQPGLYVTETTWIYSDLIYRSSYNYEACGVPKECCEFFKPGILECGLVDKCESGY